MYSRKSPNNVIRDLDRDKIAKFILKIFTMITVSMRRNTHLTPSSSWTKLEASSDTLRIKQSIVSATLWSLSPTEYTVFHTVYSLHEFTEEDTNTKSEVEVKVIVTSFQVPVPRNCHPFPNHTGLLLS